MYKFSTTSMFFMYILMKMPVIVLMLNLFICSINQEYHGSIRRYAVNRIVFSTLSLSLTLSILTRPLTLTLLLMTRIFTCPRSLSLYLIIIIVMTKQLDKIERYLGKIMEHKDMSSSCSVLHAEVTEFVAQYREEMKAMDGQGKELMLTYPNILVSYTYHTIVCVYFV